MDRKIESSRAVRHMASRRADDVAGAGIERKTRSKVRNRDRGLATDVEVEGVVLTTVHKLVK
jgi:hypothetical protein